MSETFKLVAELRAKAGKGASRAIRREGRVPAVIYGAGEAATTIHIEEKILMRQLHTGHFMNAIVELELDGTIIRTLPRMVPATSAGMTGRQAPSSLDHWPESPARTRRSKPPAPQPEPSPAPPSPRWC